MAQQISDEVAEKLLADIVKMRKLLDELRQSNEIMGKILQAAGVSQTVKK